MGEGPPQRGLGARVRDVARCAVLPAVVRGAGEDRGHDVGSGRAAAALGAVHRSAPHRAPSNRRASGHGQAASVEPFGLSARQAPVVLHDRGPLLGGVEEVREVGRYGSDSHHGAPAVDASHNEPRHRVATGADPVETALFRIGFSGPTIRGACRTGRTGPGASLPQTVRPVRPVRGGVGPEQSCDVNAVRPVRPVRHAKEHLIHRQPPGSSGAHGVGTRGRSRTTEAGRRLMARLRPSPVRRRNPAAVNVARGPRRVGAAVDRKSTQADRPRRSSIRTIAPARSLANFGHGRSPSVGAASPTGPRSARPRAPR